jgi:hypothetical protein
MAEKVPAGPYYGFTYLQLETELGNLIARRQRVSSLVGMSINGHSINREGSASELRTLDKQVQDLQEAMHMLRPDLNPYGAPSNKTVIDFRGCR